MPRISFDSSWFSKILKDYSDWRFAWVREAGQNSLDAGATQMNFTTSYDSDANETTLVWRDNGCGMTRQVIETKLMAVGGSQKAAGNAGGFGIAKLLLLFAHKGYVIETGNLVVTGKHDDYEITERDANVTGVKIRVTIVGDVSDAMARCAKNWATFTTPPKRETQMTVNGTQMDFLFDVPAPVSIESWCTLHMVPDMENGVRVRINGQFMYDACGETQKSLIVNLTGSSLEYLTSNRDGLQWSYRDKLNKMVAALTRDPKALEDLDTDTIDLFEGEMGPAHANVTERDANETNGETVGADKLAAMASMAIKMASVMAFEARKKPDEICYANETDESDSYGYSEPRRKLLPGFDFVVMNKTSQPVPSRYTPNGMKAMDWKLFARWTMVVATCARILGVTQTLRTGWIFSTTAAAIHKRSDLGHLILLNPCRVEGNSWTKAFDTTRESLYKLVALAVHELTHIQHSWHDEGFANAITYNMAKVFANMSDVSKALK